MAKQRYKIYAAEDIMEDVYTTPEGMQTWFDWIVKTKWWRDRSKVKHIKVVFPVTGAMSGAVKNAPHLATISFGVFSLSHMTACHELAHILAWPGDDTTSEEDHSPHYAGTYLSVVQRYVSAKAAKKLRAEFDKRGVKYTGGI